MSVIPAKWNCFVFLCTLVGASYVQAECVTRVSRANSFSTSFDSEVRVAVPVVAAVPHFAVMPPRYSYPPLRDDAAKADISAQAGQLGEAVRRAIIEMTDRLTASISSRNEDLEFKPSLIHPATRNYRYGIGYSFNSSHADCSCQSTAQGQKEFRHSRLHLQLGRSWHENRHGK